LQAHRDSSKALPRGGCPWQVSGHEPALTQLADVASENEDRSVCRLDVFDDPDALSHTVGHGATSAGGRATGRMPWRRNVAMRSLDVVVMARLP
jgi:hypothetical protein